MSRVWIIILILFLAARGLTVSPEDLCPICGKAYGEKAYAISKRGQEEKVIVCGECVKLETLCYICGLPVKDKLTRLADGRLLCETDTKQAVFDQYDAREIFNEVKRDAQEILSRSGPTPNHNIKLVLETKEKLDKTGANLISAHEDQLLMGMTRSTQTGDEVEHTIYLLAGLTRDRMKLVAAHEYAHTWLHENVQRKLYEDTVEGFCDWIAYKVMKEKAAPLEVKTLLASAYSKGQLQAFIAAEEQKSFYRVMQWVKHGTDLEIDPENLERILVLRENSVLTFAPPPPRSAPTNLVLKGLSISNHRRFALINDRTFELDEQGKVRLGDSNIVLRCVAFGEDAVTVQVVGESTNRLLKLSAAMK